MALLDHLCLNLRRARVPCGQGSPNHPFGIWLHFPSLSLPLPCIAICLNLVTLLSWWPLPNPLLLTNTEDPVGRQELWTLHVGAHVVLACVRVLRANFGVKQLKGLTTFEPERPPEHSPTVKQDTLRAFGSTMAII